MNRVLWISLLPALLGAQILGAQAPGVQTPGTLDLQDAISATLAGQPRLGLAESQIQAAQARQAQAHLEGLGRLDTSFVYTPRQKAMQESFGGESFEIRMNETWAFNASLDHPLYTWGAQTQRNRSAETEVAATRSSQIRTRQQLVFEATQAYTQAALEAEAVSVARKAWEQQREFLRLAQARVKAGSAARLDALKAELGVAQTQSSLSEVENRARMAREALVALTFDERFRDACLKPLEEVKPEVPSEASALAQAQLNRKDLQSLKLQAEALNLGAQAARASGKPTLSLRASVTQQNATNSLMFKRDSQQYSLGLALTWEAFGSMRSRARAAELKAQELGVRENLRSGEASAALEVRQAHARLGEALERQKVQKAALQVAEEQARIARLAYAEGTSTAVDLTEAERALTEARYQGLRAQADAWIARAALDLAVGN